MAALLFATSIASGQLAPDQSGRRSASRSRGSLAIATKRALRTSSSLPMSSSEAALVASKASFTVQNQSFLPLSRGVLHVTRGNVYRCAEPGLSVVDWPLTRHVTSVFHVTVCCPLRSQYRVMVSFLKP